MCSAPRCDRIRRGPKATTPSGRTDQRDGTGVSHDPCPARAKQVGTGFAVRAAELTGGMLGQTVSVGRPRRRRLAVNPWLRRGKRVEVVHHLDRHDKASALPRTQDGSVLKIR